MAMRRGRERGSAGKRLLIWGQNPRPAGYLVSPMFRKVWYTCRKNCLGMFCSPRRFCSNRGVQLDVLPRVRPGALSAASPPAPESPVTRGPFLGHLPGLPGDHLPIPTARTQGIKVTLQGKCLESMAGLRIVLISEANQPGDLKAGRPAGRSPIQGPRSEAPPPGFAPLPRASPRTRSPPGGTPTPTPTRHRLCPGKSPAELRRGRLGFGPPGTGAGDSRRQGLPPQSRGSAPVCFSSSPRLRPSGQCGGGKSRARLRPRAVRLRGPQGRAQPDPGGTQVGGSRSRSGGPRPAWGLANESRLFKVLGTLGSPRAQTERIYPLCSTADHPT